MKRTIGLGLVLVVTLVAAGMASRQVQGYQISEVWAARAQSAALPSSAPYFIDTLDSANDVGQHASVALDLATGVTYVSYYDATYHDLKMATFVGSAGNCGPSNSWSCETVDHVGDVGRYSSIAVDPTDGLPIIAYQDASNGALKLAIGSATGWIVKTVDDPQFGSGGLYASLALDASGHTHIAYYFSNLLGVDSLRYVQYVGGGTGNCFDPDYLCDLVDSGDRVGKHASLALDGSDQARIAYYDEGSNALKYAFEDGSTWWIRSILPTSSGRFASLVVDVENGNKPHIAHLDSSNNMLEYAVFVGSGGNCGFNRSATAFEWQCDEIESVGVGPDPRGVALAVDKASLPIIAYQSGASVLKVARPAATLGSLIGNCGPVNLFFTWQCDPLSFGISIGQADYVSLAVNNAGLATIAFYGNSTANDGDLKVATQKLQLFLPVTVKQ